LLKRAIEEKINDLYRVYQQKQRSAEVKPLKRLTPRFVSKYIAEQDYFGVLLKLLDMG